MDARYEINTLLNACVEDMKNIADSGSFTLDAQVRAYDLFSELLEAESVPGMKPDKGSAEIYLNTYSDLAEKIAAAFSQEALVNAAKARLAPLERACTDARFEAAAAASLHEFAKETYQTWQTAGIFMQACPQGFEGTCRVPFGIPPDR